MTRAARDRHGHRASSRQRGAAALTVVMMLFFIMALVAGYAGRNLIFEQKTSANTYRSTQALDAAEAAVEWTIAQINGGRIDAACRPSANVADTTFRDRYLSLQADGGWADRRWVRAGTPTNQLVSCVRNAAGLQCSCPNGGDPSPPRPDVQPAAAFAVTLVGPQGPSVIQLRAGACSSTGSVGAECFRSLDVGQAVRTDSDSFIRIDLQLALLKALPMLPAAALTAGNRVQSTATLQAVNGDAQTGLAVRAGGVIGVATERLSGPPGSAGNPRVSDDAALRLLATQDRLFVSQFGMNRTSFGQQPAAYRLPCGNACSGTDVATAVASQPGRIIWVPGDVDLDTAAVLGSAAAPVLLIVDGRLTVSGQVVLHGVMYARDISWSAPAGATVVGAVVAENDFIASSDATIAYDAAMLSLMQRSMGSFVRVPGSWVNTQ